MFRFRRTVGGMALGLLVTGFLVGRVTLEAQVVVPSDSDGRWPLQPNSPGSTTLAPFSEGWYENDDGTFSLPFGYVNTSLDTLFIPLGDKNFVDHPEFDGMQPTVFFPGRRRGVWSVTLPAEMKDTDVWWTLTTQYGHTTKVPGRIGAVAYQLDWFPRPHGSVTPSVSFDSQSGVGRGPPGIWAERTETISVGSPLTLSVDATDTSERDLDDARMVGIALRVVWSQLQGPGNVRYTRHMSNPQRSASGNSASARRSPPGPEIINLEEGHGTARVIVSFSVPGQYLMLAQVDNFDADDSGTQDQCCWSNGYVRVNVTP
jgi:hypothetical protein